MGMVWFEDSRGHKFHLPIVEDSINTPNTAIHIGELNMAGMMYSGNVQVAIQGYPTFTFAFELPGRSGSCIRCGLCCTHPPEDPPTVCAWPLNEEYGVHVCPELIIDPRKNSLGKSGRCSCAARGNLLELYKGCALWPRNLGDKYPWCMGTCGFSFVGE